MPTPARTRAELVELWSLVLSDSYTAPILEADSTGQDVPEMQAEQFACLDSANVIGTQAYYLKPHSTQLAPPAAGGSKAIGTVQITRLGTAEGVADLVEGTQLEAQIVDSLGVTRSNGLYELTEDLSFAVGESGPLTVNVQAVVEGYSGNVAAGEVDTMASVGSADVFVNILDTVTLAGVSVPGAFRDLFSEAMIGRFVTFLNSPEAEMYPRRITEFEDVGDGEVVITPALPAGVVGQLDLQVRVVDFDELFSAANSSAMTGGVTALLDAIGRDRNAPRQNAETDATYRERLCNLADVVSPNAICRITTAVLGNSGCPFAVVETKSSEFPGFTYTETIGGAPGQTDLAFKFWDSPGVGGILSGATWAPISRYFAIIIGPCILDFLGFPYDATNGPTANAWDEAFFDVGDPALGALLGALYAQVDAARAGGVAFEILFDPDQITQQCITA